MSVYSLASFQRTRLEGLCHFCRVRFSSTEPGPGFPPLAQWRDPQPAQAWLAEREALEEGAPLPRVGDRANELLVIFAESGLQTSQAEKQRYQDWMIPGGPDSQPALEVPSFGERVLWRPGQALIIGNAERFQELLDGLIAFAWYESHLSQLEGQVAEAWEPAQDDVVLTQLPSRRALARKGYLNEQVRRTTLWRMTYTRLESHLEKAPLQLSGAVRRMYNELAMQAEVHDRLQTLDDQVEVLQDLYELAADRLGEYSYFRGELWLEWFILIILVAEAGFSLWAFLGK